jgi:hypothetical protein
MQQTVITATPQQIEETFAEWIRRYRANPEQFMAPGVTLLDGAPEATAGLAAPYFIQLLADLQGKAQGKQPSFKSKIQSAASTVIESEIIIVPEVTLNDGTVVPSFRTGKYHCARVDGKAVASAKLKPVVNINYYDSVALCEASGGRIITDTQIMAIAQDAERQGINWTGGEVGKGKLFRGLHKGSVNGVQTGEYESADPEERRWFQLSNGSIIYDIAGHLFTWAFDDVQGNDKGIIARKFAKDSISLQAPYPSMTNGVGWYPKAGTDWAGDALLRGGYWHSSGNAGVCNLHYDWPSNEDDIVGVRCTYP